MAHFCETFNDPVGGILLTGFDETWITPSGGFQIANQKSQPHTCNFPNNAFRLADLDGPDMVGAIVIDRIDPVPLVGMSFGFNGVTIALRITSLITPRDYYGVQMGWSVFIPGGYFVQIFKYVANAFTQLASTAWPFVPGDRLKARIVGTTIQALVNEVEVLSVTDGSHTTSRTIGFEYFVDCATWTPPGGFPGIICDNFFGGDVAEEDNECPPVPPPGPSIPVGRTFECGPAFTPLPCPTGCGRPAFVSINPRALDVDDPGFPSPFPPFFPVVAAVPATVGRPDNCGHAFANDLTPTGDCR